jgi:hypothetical protein
MVIDKNQARNIKNQLINLRSIAGQIASNALSVDSEHTAGVGMSIYHNAQNIQNECNTAISNIERYWHV